MAEVYDFDAVRRQRAEERRAEFGEHPFVFGGETFYVKADTSYSLTKRFAAAADASSQDAASSVGLLEEIVLAMIDPADGAHDRFRAVVDGDDVTTDDIVQLQQWLTQVVAGRPPTQQESSSNGPTENGTSGTDTSSSSPEGASRTSIPGRSATSSTPRSPRTRTRSKSPT